jgi:energy-coupling factor transport system permease protein
MLSSGFVDRFQSDSIVAKLDARVKLLMILAVLILVFIWDNPIHLAALVLAVIVLSLAGGVPFRYLWRLIIITLPLALILLLIHGFFNRWYGQTPLIGPVPQWVPVLGGRLTMYKEGSLYGLGMVLRTYALMLVVPMTITTTDMNKLTLGLIAYRVPYKITFVLTMALRFAPLLIEELRAMRDAQALRGLDPSQMNFVRRLKVSAAMIVPLILGTMTKSTQLEIALQAKAFSGSSDRTYLYEINMGSLDWVVAIFLIVTSVLAIILRIVANVGGFTFVSIYAK